MEGKKVLLAGASGAVGSGLLGLMKEAGLWVRTLSRDPVRAEVLRQKADDVWIADATDAKSIEGICEGVDAVVSCVGASVALTLGQRASYDQIDTVANLSLLEEARRAGCQRFVYLSAELGESYIHTAYIQAHERVVEALKSSGLSSTVIRPTGIFTALEDLVSMARWGILPLIGGGGAKTNPVHPLDVAECCMENLWEGEQEVGVGGPEVMTRRELSVHAFRAIGKRPRFVWVPTFMFRLGSLFWRLFHPRLSQLMEFVAEVSTHDAIGPVRGTRTLGDYFVEVAKHAK